MTDISLPFAEDYDFIWLVYNLRFFHLSFWIVKLYRERDFLFTTEDRAWKVHVSKKDHDMLGDFGLRFFKNDFEKFKSDSIKEMQKIDNFYAYLKTQNLVSLNDIELANSFQQVIENIIPIWELYAQTQYFVHGKVEKLLESTKNLNLQLELDVKEMQALRLDLRNRVNPTIAQKEGYIFKPYFEEINRRFGQRDLHNYSYQEIIDLILGKKIEIEDRTNYVIGRFNNWRPIFGETARSIISEFDLITQSKVLDGVIRGRVANSGHYIGKARVIFYDLNTNLIEESAKLQDGEVLITGSTVPQMILACKNAGAIVTEEGGIASHAAIISRELGKPCIIGTHIATQVIKTGDLLEIDAIKGEIRILNV